MPDLIDDDDEENDDIQTADQMDFSQFTDQDFLNVDTATISLMGTDTLHKYNAIRRICY